MINSSHQKGESKIKIKKGERKVNRELIETREKRKENREKKIERKKKP